MNAEEWFEKNNGKSCYDLDLTKVHWSSKEMCNFADEFAQSLQDRIKELEQSENKELQDRVKDLESELTRANDSILKKQDRIEQLEEALQWNRVNR